MATPMFEGYKFATPWYMRYLDRELRHFPDMYVYWICNNSSSNFINGLREYSELNDFRAEIEDIGSFENGLVAVTEADKKAFDKAKELEVDWLYMVEQDILPTMENGSPLQKFLTHLNYKKVGLCGGTYHYKKLASVIDKDAVYVDAPEGNLPDGNIDKWRQLVMARVSRINHHAMKQLKKGLNYVDVDGIPFGFTCIKKAVFQEFDIPAKENWEPFGSQDLAFCERIKSKWLIRLLRKVRAYHLYFDKNTGEIIVY